MYVLQNWTFTPGAESAGTIELPGVYTIEQFAHITNLTRNIPLFDAESYEATITLVDNGLSTTLTLRQNTSFCEATDELQITLYDLYAGGVIGPATNVAVTNWPTSQNVNGTVDVGNFPATQTVDGTVDVGNFPTSFDVGNFPATQTVDGTVDVGNFPATQTVAGTVDVGNFPATQTVDGTVDVGNFPATQTVDGSVSVSNFPTSFDVGNFPATQTVDGTVDVGNFPATQTVDGTVTANQGTSPWVVSGTTTAAIGSFPITSTDAFNRLRVSQPLTLFDSSHRYADNNLWSTSTATGGTAVFNEPQGLVDLTVTGTTGSKVYRETTKVFSYQPGKSLLVDNTFVLAAPLVGLRQRAGYFGTDNGYFLETDDLAINFVERSLSTGTETRVAQADWNYDPMDGTGPSGITLTITNAQIFWMDLQWLGVGTVRMGFEINGQAYLCHQWQHANLLPSTYITTASLPLRIELENTGTTGVASTLKQICSSVISEGGYTLVGLQQGVGTPITTPHTLTTAGTYYPVVSLRLKATRLDAIAILTAVSLLGNGNNETFRWQVMASSTVTGGTWVSAGSDSSVEYNLTGTGISGGRILAAGYTTSSNQGSPTIDISREALFTFQLERDSFTATPYTLSVAIAGAANAVTCYASMDWEEVSR
jgi:hypothetical protein